MRSLISLSAIAQVILILWPLSPAAGQTPDAGEDRITSAGRVAIIAWNIEAGGSSIAKIAAELEEMEPFDILALSEVPQASVSELAARWGRDAYLASEKGGPARLLIAWDPKVFEKLEAIELKEVGGKEFAPGLQAAPLVVHLKHTASGRELIVVMNHFARGSAELRKSQALLLSQWAGQQDRPIIAVGGYNFDYDFPTRKGNESFDAFMKTGVWKWIQPKTLVDDNWADRDRDGKDDYPNSMLDFVFAAGPAREWAISSEVIVRPGDFPDTEQTSDHRPTRTVVEGLTPAK